MILIIFAGVCFYIAFKLFKEQGNKEEQKNEKIIEHTTLDANNMSLSHSEENYYHRDSYLRLMKKYENISGELCEKVGWREYDYEAYRHMTKEKRNWYLYWRSQVRNGVYLDTDFAYIHCYITEVVNGIGGLSAQQIYHTLEKVKCF